MILMLNIAFQHYNKCKNNAIHQLLYARTVEALALLQMEYYADN